MNDDTQEIKIIDAEELEIFRIGQDAYLKKEYYGAPQGSKVMIITEPDHNRNIEILISFSEFKKLYIQIPMDHLTSQAPPE